MYRINNWSKHQHFKDRTPPWIKLYRDILDDPDWHELDGDIAKLLVSLWLIASEDETHEGRLPDSRRLAFRLRITEKQLNQALNKLSHWLVHDDIKPISSRYQDDAPERAGEETETEKETEGEKENACADNAQFSEFWKAYPKKIGKKDATRAWKRAKINGHFSEVMQALEAHKSSEKWIKGYIHNPATWINGRHWEDEIPVAQPKRQDTGPPWWSTNAGIEAKGAELGMRPRGGESWHDFKARINQRLETT